VNSNESDQSPDSPSTILVAEDNPDSRDALRALLEAYGFTVFEAADGAETIEKALGLRPDLILMDVMMPVTDGLQATRTLRSHPDFQQVPILALTAMAGSQDLARSAGCDDYLTKPIQIPHLLHRIRKWLETGRSPMTPVSP